MATNAGTTLCDELVFAEAPRWRDGWLYFSDMYADTVFRVSLEGDREVVATVDLPGGLGWSPEGELLVVSMARKVLVRVAADGRQTDLDLSSAAVSAVNDIGIHPAGHAYIGQFGFELPVPEGAREAPGNTPLLLVSGDAVRTASDDLLGGANGIAIAADGRTLITAETWDNRLTAFTIADDGTLSDRRVFAELDDAPDGICLDSEGAVWAGTLHSRRFVRVREGGEIVDEIHAGEGRHAIACALGGPDGTTLFMCTAAALDDAGIYARAASRIELTRVEIPGAGFP